MQSQSVKKTTGQDLSAFQTILDFVTNLQEYFGVSDKHVSIHALNLYHRLISKMGFTDDTLIMKHIEVFKDFCLKNRNEIRNRDIRLSCSNITFTDRIFIDMTYIFNNSDAETKHVIWEYLMTISAYVDPENGTKGILQSLCCEPAPKIENPMAVLGSLMNSPLFSTMMGSMSNNMENGTIDLTKLMGTMVGLVDTVKNEIENSDDPTLKNMLNMLQQAGPMNTD